MKIVGKEMLALTACAILSLSLATGGQKAKDKDKEKGKEKGTTSAHTTGGVDARVAIDIFTSGDRDLISTHFRTSRSNLPPGLAKRGGDLPPGLEKQLRRNGHLPPGLEKKIDPFPIELERNLPPLKPGLIRGVIGGSAVIMNSKTMLILDVFAIL